MIKTKLTVLLLCCMSSLMIISCSDNGPAGPNTNVVTNPLPLALGNRWDYVFSQSMSIDTDADGVRDLSLSSMGYQSVNIRRIEAFEEGESFGLEYNHVIQYLADNSKADTTVEVRYMVPLKDRILFKAVEEGYNTGGFVPFGDSDKDQTNKIYTRISVGGREIDISLNELARLRLEPLPSYIPNQELDALLASDGVRNKDNAFTYDGFEYIYLYKELYKGLEWGGDESAEFLGVRVTQKVTNILSELDGFDGPIAEVSVTTSVDSEGSFERYYYKSGIGLIRAEIYDPKRIVRFYLGNGVLIQDYGGEWAIVKQLVAYTVK